jgi:hypothetical protein
MHVAVIQQDAILDLLHESLFEQNLRPSSVEQGA